MCVQRFDDSLNSAIHITYRISLRSSSMPEPRDPLLKVLSIRITTQTARVRAEFGKGGPARGPRGAGAGNRDSGGDTHGVGGAGPDGGPPSR